MYFVQLRIAGSAAARGVEGLRAPRAGIRCRLAGASWLGALEGACCICGAGGVGLPQRLPSGGRLALGDGEDATRRLAGGVGPFTWGLRARRRGRLGGVAGKAAAGRGRVTAGDNVYRIWRLWRQGAGAVVSSRAYRRPGEGSASHPQCRRQGRVPSGAPQCRYRSGDRGRPGLAGVGGRVCGSNCGNCL
jgi:hypothetical protein